MGCFDRSPSDTADAGTPDAGAPTDAGVPLPGGVPDARDPSSPVSACACASSIRIEGCRVVGVNGRVTLRAVVDCGSGDFHWTTSSSKVTLVNADSSEVEVRAGARPSGGRGQEVITVQWTGYDCAPVSQTVNLTVVEVVFSESASESYGYDNMDTPGTHTDDHVSVKRAASTVVHTVVRGGLNGNELDFVSLDTSKATVGAAAAAAAFDLSIRGGDQDKAETNLVARARCPGNPEITRMYINVYKEKVVRATVAKIYDSRHSATNLRFPNLNVRSAQTLINPKAKAAVVRYEISDHSSSGGSVDIPYDNDGNGKLTWDITASGGTEFSAIQSGFTASGVRIAIVRDMVSQYFLSAAAARGATTITLRGISNNNFYSAGQTVTLGSGSGAEQVTIQSASNNSATVTLSAALTKNHASGEAIEFPAGGWGSDPIVILEGSASEEVIKWTFFHETGHSALSLADLDAQTDIMHFCQNWSDHRLRYKPENKKYGSGTENQWETIGR